MLVLQAYQADLLKEIDEREAMSSDDITELRRIADLALRATKQTARAIGWSMAAMVAVERHLWHLWTLKTKTGSSYWTTRLCLWVCSATLDSHQEAHRDAGAFQWFLPHRPLAQAAARWEQPQPRASSSYREAQRQSVTTRAPSSRDRDGKWHSGSGPSKLKTDLRAVLQAKKALKKPWCPWHRAYEGSPHWRGTVFTVVPGTRSLPVPSGGRSANPGAPGRSDLQRTYISVSSAWKHGNKMLTTPSGASRAASSAIPCQLHQKPVSRDRFVTIYLKDAFFHVSILPTHGKFLWFAFRGRSLPVSGYSVWPSTLITHFHEACGCCVSSIAATGHSYTQLHRQLVDSRSIRVEGGSASRCQDVLGTGAEERKYRNCSNIHDSADIHRNYTVEMKCNNNIRKIWKLYNAIKYRSRNIEKKTFTCFNECTIQIPPYIF